MHQFQVTLIRFSRVSTDFHFLGNRMNRAMQCTRFSIETMMSCRIYLEDDYMHIVKCLAYDAIKNGDPECLDHVRIELYRLS